MVLNDRQCEKKRRSRHSEKTNVPSCSLNTAGHFRQSDSVQITIETATTVVTLRLGGEESFTGGERHTDISNHIDSQKRRVGEFLAVPLKLMKLRAWHCHDDLVSGAEACELCQREPRPETEDSLVWACLESPLTETSPPLKNARLSNLKHQQRPVHGTLGTTDRSL